MKYQNIVLGILLLLSTKVLALPHSTPSQHNALLCQKLVAPGPDGPFFWQKKASYCAAFPDALVRKLEEEKGLPTSIPNPYDRIEFYLRVLPSWTPDKDLPWDEMPRVRLQNFAISWESWKKLASIVVTSQKFEKHLSNLGIVAQQYEEVAENHTTLETPQDLMFSSIMASVLKSMVEARMEFLGAHADAIKNLLDNYFYFSAAVMTRYKDALQQDWPDLMPANFYISLEKPPAFAHPFEGLKGEFVLLPLTPETQALATAIEAYHKIPKTLVEKIPERRKALGEIQALALKIHDPLAAQIAKRAKMKSAYIAKLPGLRKEALLRAFHLPKNKTHVVVPTHGDVITDLDPAKRSDQAQKSVLFSMWEAEVEKDPKTPDYFLWLEGQNTEKMLEDLRHRFLSAAQRKVEFKGGHAYNAIFAGPHGYVHDGGYFYNIGEREELYITPFNSPTLDYFRRTLPPWFSAVLGNRGANHDTLLGGENVMSAGFVIFKDGKIIHIDTNSGHYMPSMLRHLRPALIALVKKYPGILAGDATIGDCCGRVSLSYAQFLKATPQDVGRRPLLTPEEIKDARQKAVEVERKLALKKSKP